MTIHESGVEFTHWPLLRSPVGVGGPLGGKMLEALLGEFMTVRSDRDIQAAVLRAISRGNRTPDKIAKSAHISIKDVYTRLTRLRCAGLIQCKREMNGRFRKVWHICDARVLLFDIW